MNLAIKRTEAWDQLVPFRPVTNAEDIVASWGTIELWSEAEREEFGLFEIEEPPAAPEGKMHIPGGLIDRDGRPIREYTVEDVAPPPLPELNDYRIAVQERVDAVAQTKRYDSGVSMASYTNSTDPTWAAEAQAFVAWRDRVWGLVYSLMDGVLSGEIAQPSIEELLTELPAIEWPSVKAA